MENKTSNWTKDYKWFHSIDFGNGIKSSGRFSKTTPQNYTLYGVFEMLKAIDLNGMSCLDIGTMDGITAFTMKQQGAEKVVATDMSRRETFIKAREHLGYDIEYHTPYRMDAISELLGTKKMDLIVNAGILYHVFDPLESLALCRELIKENGLLILETQYLYDQRKPVMLFNPCDSTRRRNPHANTFWKASKGVVEGMLEVAGFKVLNTISVNGRLTVLAKACKPSEIDSKHPLVQKIHSDYKNYENYGENINYSELEEKGKISNIKFKGKHGERFLFRSLYKSDNLFQADWEPANSWIKMKSVLNDIKFWIGTKYSRLFNK